MKIVQKKQEIKIKIAMKSLVSNLRELEDCQAILMIMLLALRPKKNINRQTILMIMLLEDYVISTNYDPINY